MAECMTMAERHSNLPTPLEWRGVRCAPLEPMARFVFRGGVDACRHAGQSMGLEFPAALRASVLGARSVLWQGPDEFLILAPDDERLMLGATLEAALAREPHALVDVSHRNIAFVIEGERAALLLATGIMLDLAPSAFPVGMTTRTLFGKADVTLWRQATDRFHLETWRSIAPYVVGLLQAGARVL